MLIEASYGYPKHIGYVADSSHTIAADDVITFRVGVPGPVDGVIDTPLVEQALTRDDTKHASGTVPAASLDFDPGEYGWHVEIERLGIVARGLFRLLRSVGHT